MKKATALFLTLALLVTLWPARALAAKKSDA